MGITGTNITGAARDVVMVADATEAPSTEEFWEGDEQVAEKDVDEKDEREGKEIALGRTGEPVVDAEEHLDSTVEV